MFEDRVAFITGAEGIGGATARLLAQRGARVCVMARTEEDLQALVAEIEEAGGTAMYVQGDVSESEDLERAYARIDAAYGRLDVVFANAGINGTWAPIEELSLADWQQTLSVNLTGTFLTVKHAVPYLKRRGGSIIITASVNGTRMFSNSGATAYAVTKAGQVALAQMLALELAPHGIRVNAICPGAIDTEIEEHTNRKHLDTIRYPVTFPEGKVPLTGGTPGTAEQVAQLVAFLASDDASLITGTPVWIDGAQSLFQG